MKKHVTFATNHIETIPFNKIELNPNSKKQIRKLRKILDFLSDFDSYKTFGHPTTNIRNIFGTDDLGVQLQRSFLVRYGSYSTGQNGAKAHTYTFQLVKHNIEKAHAYLYPFTLNEAGKVLDKTEFHKTPVALEILKVDAVPASSKIYLTTLLKNPAFHTLSFTDKERIINRMMRHIDELTGKIPYQYSDKAYRLWHGLQNMSRKGKEVLFSLFHPYDYDAEACAITVIVEFSNIWKCADLDRIPSVLEYIADRKVKRQYFCDMYGIDMDTSKQIYQALVNRAMINPVWGTCGYSELFEDSVEGFEIASKIADDKVLKKFKREMKYLWGCVMYGHNVCVRDGKIDGDYLANKDRFTLYFKLERGLLEVAKEFLELKGAKYFCEHDGFRSDIEISKIELEEYVRNKLGYSLIKYSS